MMPQMANAQPMGVMNTSYWSETSAADSGMTPGDIQQGESARASYNMSKDVPGVIQHGSGHAWSHTTRVKACPESYNTGQDTPGVIQHE